MDMIIKSKDKHGNIIEFNPKGRGARYTVNGLKKKGVTTIIGERFGKGALMWWAENCVFEALYQKLKYDKKAVDEEVRGSRSRNIQAIYLENSAGERFQYPHNHLAGARAMLRHVKEGGTPYDDFGQHIIEQSKELSDLYKFERWVNKNGLIEGNDDVVEVVKEQKNKIREHIKKLQSQSYYESCSCEYKHNKQTTSPAKVNNCLLYTSPSPRD